MEEQFLIPEPESGAANGSAFWSITIDKLILRLPYVAHKDLSHPFDYGGQRGFRCIAETCQEDHIHVRHRATGINHHPDHPVTTHATDDPTKSSLAFITTVGALGAGKEVAIALLGDAVYLAKKEVAQNVHGVVCGSSADCTFAQPEAARASIQPLGRRTGNAGKS